MAIGSGNDSRIIVLLIDGHDIRPVTLLHAIVGALKT